jgi:hypothetical protein
MSEIIGPHMCFLVDGFEHPYCCRIVFPDETYSICFATKYRVCQYIKELKDTGCLSAGIASALKDQVNDSTLPDEDPRLDSLMDMAECAKRDLIRYSRRVSPSDRGVVQ